LEGLEVSEVMLSEVLKDNDEYRIDSDFFRKEILSIINFINNKPHIELCKLVKNIKSFGAYSLCNYINFVEKNENSIPFVRCLNIKNGILNNNNLLYIDKDSNDILWKSEIKPLMVLVTMSGTVGNSTVALDSWKYPINSNQDIAKIEVDGINPFYLSTFLNTKYGYFQMNRLQAGAIQQHLYLSQIEKLRIPTVIFDFQNQIEKIVIDAHSKREQSQSLYRQAEELLLETIGLKDFQPARENINIKRFSESFLATGRLDAEYYLPKYEEMEAQIKKIPFNTIENICSAINYGTVPTSPYTDNGEGIPYIKGMNLKYLQIAGELDKITNTEKLPEKFYTKEGDIIISQMGTVGDVGIISKKEEGFLFASFTIRIRIKDKKNYNPYYVGLYIQNIAKEWYLLRNIAQASVRQNTDLPTIRNMYIPIIDNKIQRRIAALIERSFSMRQESERLLSEAKDMVEREIEKDTADSSPH
jgi:restriction endonuclease S subunit